MKSNSECNKTVEKNREKEKQLDEKNSKSGINCQNQFSGLAALDSDGSNCKDDNYIKNGASKKRFRRKKNRSNKKNIDENTCNYCNKNKAQQEISCSCGYKICLVCWEKKLQKGIKNCPKCSKKLPYNIGSSGNSSAGHSPSEHNCDKKDPGRSFNAKNENEKGAKDDAKVASTVPNELKFKKNTQKKIIEEYHVNICQKYLENKCPFDFFKCFDSHEPNYLRRKPCLDDSTSSGWNYSSDMCTQIEKEMRCDNSDYCCFAHSTDEKLYHPDKFRRILCNAFAGNTACPRGDYCYKAHGQNDFITLVKEDYSINDRMKFAVVPLIEREQIAEVNRNEKQSGTVTDFLKMTVHNATTDANFYMFEYKTKPCLNSPCSNMRCCTNYHHDQERRRSPRDFQYSAEPCTLVKLPLSGNNPGKWREPSRCEKLVLCEFAHTLLEQMYHPHIYKTSLCSNFTEGEEMGKQNCLWGNLCTHAHGKGDLRVRNDPSKIFVYANKVKSVEKKTLKKELDISKIRQTKPTKFPDKSKNAKIKMPTKTNDKKDADSPLANLNISFSEALKTNFSSDKSQRQGALLDSKNSNDSQLSKDPPLQTDQRSFSSSKSIEQSPLAQDTLSDNRSGASSSRTPPPSHLTATATASNTFPQNPWAQKNLSEPKNINGSGSALDEQQSMQPEADPFYRARMAGEDPIWQRATTSSSSQFGERHFPREQSNKFPGAMQSEERPYFEYGLVQPNEFYPGNYHSFDEFVGYNSTDAGCAPSSQQRMLSASRRIDQLNHLSQMNAHISAKEQISHRAHMASQTARSSPASAEQRDGQLSRALLLDINGQKEPDPHLSPKATSAGNQTSPSSHEQHHKTRNEANAQQSQTAQEKLRNYAKNAERSNAAPDSERPKALSFSTRAKSGESGWARSAGREEERRGRNTPAGESPATYETEIDLSENLKNFGKFAEMRSPFDSYGRPAEKEPVGSFESKGSSDGARNYFSPVIGPMALPIVQEGWRAASDDASPKGGRFPRERAGKDDASEAERLYEKNRGTAETLDRDDREALKELLSPYSNVYEGGLVDHYSQAAGRGKYAEANAYDKKKRLTKISASVSAKPLQIVQDSPMYELFGERIKESADSMIIDYKELFVNLRKKHVCPVCQSPKAARDNVLVSCGHFFCGECVEKMTVAKDGFGISIECAHCRKKSDRILNLLLD